MEFFTTQNRKLEAFLHAHEIAFHHFGKAEDGMTVWYYVKDDYLLHVLEEWKTVLRRRKTAS